MTNELLVVGATGLVGRNVLRHFETKLGWGLTALSRRAPDFPTRARFVAADLLDSAACAEAASQLRHITHVLYCANSEPEHLFSGWLDAAHIEANEAMVRNLFEPLRRSAAALQRLILMQGTKYYGAAAGTFKIPAKETDPRSLAPNFYYGQEDYIRAVQQGAVWTWTALRPQFVCGFAVGSPMNGLTGLASYACISRELGLPLRFPGGDNRVHEATDSRLLAQAVEWAATTASCANEAFNIVNGDCYTWDSLWPKIAALFRMEWAPPAPARLARIMPSKAAIWDGIVQRHHLRPYTLKQLVPNWGMTDYILGYKTPEQPMFVSGLKARQYGFHACVDSEQMYLDWLRLLQDERIIPI